MGLDMTLFFFLPHLNSHLAELTKEEKNKISHRSAAWKKTNDETSLTYSFKN
ncbi:MAG: hypothetical protein Ct9H90mP4_10740 [Gammaproteobacteria bacterium]|nr:MAG: hypothetical protein Ct9H90mP4_10740 [Gammaproteobacteria bacterium]